MKNGFRSEHFTDENGKPAGGHTFGTGFAIGWQHGPLGQHSERCDENECAADCMRKGPNGAFVEDIIEAAADRLLAYQRTEFACEKNEKALQHLGKALFELAQRTAEREERGVEGTHEK